MPGTDQIRRCNLAAVVGPLPQAVSHQIAEIARSRQLADGVIFRNFEEDEPDRSDALLLGILEETHCRNVLAVYYSSNSSMTGRRPSRPNSSCSWILPKQGSACHSRMRWKLVVREVTFDFGDYASTHKRRQVSELCVRISGLLLSRS